MEDLAEPQRRYTAGGVALVVWGLFVVASFLTLLLPLLASEITGSLGVDYTEFNVLSETFVIVGTVSLIIWGVICDRFGEIKSLAVAISSIGIGGLTIAISANYSISIFGAAICGAGTAGLPFIGLVIFCRHAPESSFGRWFLIPVLASSWGVFVGPTIVRFMTSAVSWRVSLAISIVIAGLCSVCLLLIAKQIYASPPEYPMARKVESINHNGGGALVFIGLAVALTVGQKSTGTIFLPGNVYEVIGGTLPSYEVLGGLIFVNSLATSIGLIIGAVIADLSKRSIWWVVGVLFCGATVAFCGIGLIFPKTLTPMLLMFSFGLMIGVTHIPLLKIFVSRSPQKFLGTSLACFKFCLVGGLAWLLYPVEPLFKDATPTITLGWLSASLLIAAASLVLVHFLIGREETNQSLFRNST
jgi:MFS family permease